MTLAAWNVRTLLERGNRHERRSAIIARELGGYGVDIAALSETRLSGQTQFEEIGAGYRDFCQGYPEDEPRHGGIVFAVRSSLLKSLQSTPHGISTRVMTLQLCLEGHLATIISC